MTALIITIHVLVCVFLIGIILVQRGRGGGLAESFSGVESMFGTKTNAFLTRTTTVLSILFFITCLSLALIAARQSRSLMRNVKVSEQPVTATTAPGSVTPAESAPAQAEAPRPATTTSTQDSMFKKPAQMKPQEEKDKTK